MRYAYVIERARRNYAAYVPDLPGCVATADTRAGVIKLLREAVKAHLAGMKEDGEDIPEPTSAVGHLDVQLV
jgi:predicted RNase H-like HicB family nuclease